MNDAIREAGGLSPEQVELVKRTICRGASDDELALFVNVCNRTGLDPFAKQIHAVKRWDSTQRREVMAIQVAIDGFRLIAERTEKYAPGREPTYQYDADGKLLSATAYVKKLAGGVWHEVAASAFFAEYVQTNKEGQPTRFWQRMPHVMLAKCAESLALRRAFPMELSGLYTEDEMHQADTPARVEVRQPAAAIEDRLALVRDHARQIEEAETEAELKLAWAAAWKDKRLNQAEKDQLCALKDDRKAVFAQAPPAEADGDPEPTDAELFPHGANAGDDPAEQRRKQAATK